MDAHELVVGHSYRLRRFTPLMPAFQPKDPLRSITNMVYLRPGIIIEVLEIKLRRRSPWYKVRTTYQDEPRTGWVNSIALIGQDIAES